LTIIEDDEDLSATDCAHCGGLAEACPSRDKPTVKEISASDLILEVLNHSTVSTVVLTGGEPLTQPEFTLEFLKHAKKVGLKTIVDTTGHGEWHWLEEMIPYVDQFLFEIKIVDEESYRVYTGLSNDSMLENLKKLCAAGCNVVFRYPLLTGFNDDVETARSIARLAENCGIYRISILKNPNVNPLKKKPASGIQRRNRLPDPIEDKTWLLQRIFSVYCMNATVDEVASF